MKDITNCADAVGMDTELCVVLLMTFLHNLNVEFLITDVTMFKFATDRPFRKSKENRLNT